MFIGILSLKWWRERKYRDAEAEVRELREELKRYKNAEKQEVQCETANEEGKF